MFLYRSNILLPLFLLMSTIEGITFAAPFSWLTNASRAQQRFVTKQTLKKYGIPALVATAVAYKYITDWRHETVIPGMTQEQLKHALTNIFGNKTSLDTPNLSGEKTISFSYKIEEITEDGIEVRRYFGPLHPLNGTRIYHGIGGAEVTIIGLWFFSGMECYQSWSEIADKLKALNTAIIYRIADSKKEQNDLLATGNQRLIVKLPNDVKIFDNHDHNESFYSLWGTQLQSVREALRQLKYPGNFNNPEGKP